MSSKDKRDWREAGKSIKRSLSNLWGDPHDPNEDVLAIVVGDVHLSNKPPVARSAEPDWYAAMERSLQQIRNIQNRKDCEKAETFFVGDIFHKWNSSAKLINFAICHLPKGYSIYGQHDLPHHRYEDIKESAYWTVTHEGGCLEHLPSDGIPIPVNGKLIVSGFGWKNKIKPWEGTRARTLHYLAFIHKYIWQEGTGYTNAPKSHHINRIRSRLEGYDAAFFGDNHTPFFNLSQSPKIINCGSLMARHTDQREYSPSVYFVYESGAIGGEVLDTSEDKWLTEEELTKQLAPEVDLGTLMKCFKRLEDKPADFWTILQRMARSKKVRKSVRRLILSFLEESNDG